MSHVKLMNARLLTGEWVSLALEPGSSSIPGKIQGVVVESGAVRPAAGSMSLRQVTDFAALGPGTQVDAEGMTIVPAAIDAHIHAREPGLEHKETWSTVALGAFRGGVICVADMPNTKPPTMTRDAVLQKARCAAASGVDFRFWLGVGKSNVSGIAELLADESLPLAGLKVFYGQSTGDLMFADLDALERHLPQSGAAREKTIVFHSEDQCAIDHNADILRAEIAKNPDSRRDFRLHSRIRSSAAALSSTRIILDWAVRTKRPAHIAHVSTPGEIEMINEAKARGARVTGEVAPHHLLFSIDDYDRLGPWIKINPPVRSRAEVDALRKLVGAGLVDIFATDHAPHTKEEKAKDIEGCPSGAPALEYFYPLLLRIMADTGLAPAKALDMVTTAPAQLLGLHSGPRIAVGERIDLVAIDRRAAPARHDEVVSKCGWTPYDGMSLPCRVIATWKSGRRVWSN